MSLNTQEKIRCPKCGTLNDITLWQSLTVSDSQDLKQELLSGKLNVLTCSDCGARALVPTPLLYHDEDKKLMISFMPTETAEEAQKQFASIKESSRQSGELNELCGYNLRYVSDYNSLLEKILIFDSGLNDKTVEVIKLMVLMQEPELAEKRSALFGKKYEDGSVEIMVQNLDDGAVFTSRAPAETYTTIHTELLRSGVKDISFDWEMVDKDYAAKLLGY
ncbi:MAG: CpXC domain-containing protein [Clostridia bacterium]|nr:CpXC domain-containing protein [Clostridia bacterium]